MHDILFFGAGFNGDKRDIEKVETSIRYPAKSVIFGSPSGQGVSVTPQYTGFYEFQIQKFTYRDKTYLIAIHGDAPPNHIIEYAIETERPNSID